MKLRSINDHYAVSPQIAVADLPAVKDAGFAGIICFRPDGEDPDQPTAAEIGVAAETLGLQFVHVPVRSGGEPDAYALRATRRALEEMPGKVLGYCKGGGRAERAYMLAATTPAEAPAVRHFDVVIVGGGAGGIAAAASLLKRRPGTTIGIVEPSLEHYYQPGWTLVGAGVFTPEQTRRSELTIMPAGANWLRNAAKTFHPDTHSVTLDDDTSVTYSVLVVALGIKLDWDGIEGLADTLGRNGVTSNYRYDLAPYTWELVRSLRSGTALFTQPPMPIKCAGAPQKAAYLSCSEWERRGVKHAIDVAFDTATPALFGVADYVPPLMDYIRKYDIALHLRSKLVRVDGERRIATFERTTGAGPESRTETVERSFDMLHVVPPQTAPDVLRESPLAGADGFLSVDPATLRHTAYEDVYGLGDCIGASNAKTAAAVRKQAPVVAHNVVRRLREKAGFAVKEPVALYSGYGACPLTVEKGKIVLAEFGYGGKLMPTLPEWILKGTTPTRLAWFLKEKVMPLLYWYGMFRGHEILVKPDFRQED
ncbi:bifunctional protein tyrosine phosphatase family protein/NAD(P)/FAD-dependent oxidoreductase [Acidomonas methanolica]|uniref:bifunctional protein tyrosine phosphatase family protein/NAD(P)/FAD-dependent oxidoreductase n=1 Tax=Acidomonas methanolica TaxID=437 RepID=UPI001C040B5B|nr:bifunctional protein tyrosine phosphatase family protein/NAD(P)/FAD-dependent oxidoreductase [Acidomonas methanolica]MBU2654217.1 bifunctional protein tyrosine phosphatase family protein/NAD(P)/FAD-dependent oxidoreductase [Acidomonas methanolica]